jgi:hypothetical protein
MLTLVYSKVAQSEAEELAAAFVKKSKGKRTPQHVGLVSEEQLKAWNTTVSRLHASLAEVLLIAETKGIDAPTTCIWVMLSSPVMAREFLRSLAFLRTASKQNPSLLTVGYHSLPSELSKLLATVCLNAGLINTDSTFQSEGLMGTIAAISGEVLKKELKKAEKNCPALNG